MEFFSFSDTREPVHVLQDQKIEEKTITADETKAAKNEENNKRPTEALNPTEFYLFKQNSMAIYYGWQIVCLMLVIFTAYETLQSV